MYSWDGSRRYALLLLYSMYIRRAFLDLSSPSPAINLDVYSCTLLFSFQLSGCHVQFRKILEYSIL